MMSFLVYQAGITKCYFSAISWQLIRIKLRRHRENENSTRHNSKTVKFMTCRHNFIVVSIIIRNNLSMSEQYFKVAL